jgi:alpha-tubulin suppressor-like RCC1 family protein
LFAVAFVATKATGGSGMGSFKIIGGVAGLVLLAGSSSLILPPSVGASSGAISEWGKPVASGGPGPSPSVVQTFANAVQIDAGNASVLVVLSDGTVWGWGFTEVGTRSMTAVQIPGLQNVLQRPVDGNHDFAALEQPGGNPSCPESSTVMTWGLNGAGDLGLGDSHFSHVYLTAQDVKALDCQNVVQLAAANGHMLALTASGDVYVWGGGGSDLGLGGSVQREISPTLNTAASALTGGIATGVVITAAVSASGLLVGGQAYSWGSNIFGQCGCGSTAAAIDVPTAVSQGSLSFTWIDQGGNFDDSNGHELALTSRGAVWAWGAGALGQLGTGGTANSDVPVAVSGLSSGVVDVRADGEQSMALDASGNVWLWGSNANGQIGNRSGKGELLPAEVLSGVTEISAGSLYSLALS